MTIAQAIEAAGNVELAAVAAAILGLVLGYLVVTGVLGVLALLLARGHRWRR